MAKYTAHEIKNWDMARGPDWKPLRPINHICHGIAKRLKLAFGVLVGRYDALDWEDQDDLLAAREGGAE